MNRVEHIKDATLEIMQTPTIFLGSMLPQYMALSVCYITFVMCVKKFLVLF